ncbi:MAG: T9SS type A sorting domain-containing protein [Bacteroidales bacterium]|nr:T9SS type A sorting domain-containing protein [Bacteroidales bacterium]
MRHIRLSLILLISTFIMLPAWGQNVAITNPLNNSVYLVNETFDVKTIVNSVVPGIPVHLNVTNNLTGYRKLKIGNNPTSLYSPKVNVAAGGNTTLSITLRDNLGNADWSKIRFKPQGLGTLDLASYVTNAGGIGTTWTTITIPLADFDPAIDFTQIANIEFPYSADAGSFNIDVADISFTGGLYPYQWFGDNKNDNIQNGNGGPGELVAQLIQETAPISDVEKLETYVDGNLANTDFDFPFETSLSFGLVDTFEVHSKVYYIDQTTEQSSAIHIIIEDIPTNPPLSISLSSPLDGSIIEHNESAILQAEVSGAQPTELSYIEVSNSLSGFRKLKFGYNPTNLYGAGQNVLGGGNDTLEIVLKETTGFANWSKIRIRPNAIGSINMASYINMAGGVVNDYTTIKIPLSDFDQSINFYGLSYFEFPYSADAGAFNIVIQSMKFTGANEFIWFGESKTDNAHNGNGGAGELVANIVEPTTSGILIEKVEFYEGANLLNVDFYAPYKFLWSDIEPGTYNLSAKVFANNNTNVSSSSSEFTVNPPDATLSPLTVSIASPLNNDNFVAPLQLTIESEVSGLPSNEPTHLKVVNDQSGFRKLKLGYNPQNIYGPTNNVIAGGNDTLKITLKDFVGNAAWNKIRIKPSQTGTMNLAAYIPANTADWFQIKIPLTDFDPGIDFTQIAFFEFPYSADAGYFDLGILKMEFTGGTTPFLWFGETKTDNIHNGNGGSGELTATLEEYQPNPLLVDSVSFYNDSILLGSDNTAPYSIDYPVTTAGDFKLVAVVVDNSGLNNYSDTTWIHVDATPGAQTFTITVLFDSVPDSCTVSLAPLKYNKDFAMSFTIDDGRADAYTHAYPLLNGGYVAENQTTYPGLFATDGCGNDISFTAGLAWYSVSSSLNDLHINTPDFMTWSQLSEMYNNGWDVINHSYSHAAYNNVDYDNEITQNELIVGQQTGIVMSHFVPPSGDTGYNPYIFAKGYKSIFGNNSAYLGYNSGLQVDNPLNYQQPKIYRRFLYDGAFDTTNIAAMANQLATSGQLGNHYWWNEATHRVHGTPTGGSLIFSTYSWYMNYLQNTYGKYGTDQLWMASSQEVYEYLRVKDETGLSYFLNGNQLQITIDYADVPEDLRRFALTLNIDANQAFQVVSCEDSIIQSFNGVAPNKLINLDWSPETIAKSTGYVPDNAEIENGMKIYPNPAINTNVTVYLSSQEDETGILSVIDLTGRTVFSQQVLLQKNKIVQFPITTSSLIPGTYVVRYTSSEQIESKLLIVQ